MQPLRTNGDLISGAVLTSLGIYVIVEARRWDYLAPDGPGPGFFPVWYGIALVALSLVLMIGAVRKRSGAPGQAVNWAEVGRGLIVWGALTACIALLKVLGFLVSFALLTIFVACVMYGRPLWHGIAAGVLGSAIFYLIFPLALNVALPVGVLGL